MIKGCNEKGEKMRDIKFRAWNKVNKIMYNDAINNCLDEFSMVIKHPQIYEVMQYIGFKDNEGVEIYDEDIAEFYEGDTLVKAEIEWLQEECRFVARVSNKTEQYYLGLDGDEKLSCVVIGNMYENKGLLEI